MRLCAEAGDDPRCQRRDDHHDRRHRQEPQRRRQRAVAEDQLEVLRDEEHHAEHRQEHEDHAAGGGAEGRVAEVRHVEHGFVASPFPEHEDHEHDEADRERRERLGARPTLVGRLDQSVDDGGDPDDRQAGADQIELRLLGVLRPRHEEHAEHQRGEDDRHVDEEDRPEPEVAQEPSAGDGPDGTGAAGDAGPDRDGLGSLFGGEDVDEDRQRRGHDERGARTHQRPAGDELPHRGRGRGERHRRGSRRDPVAGRPCGRSGRRSRRR